MQAAPTGAPHSTARTELDRLLESWRRHLRAQRISPATISTYSTAVGQLSRFLEWQGMPTSPAGIRREHVEAFITDILEHWKPATAHNRYRGCHAFFRWLLEEGEIRDNPMERMKPPRLPEEPPPVLREAELRALLAVCERDKTFAGRRDEAVLRVFMDTGARRGEVLQLGVADVDLEQGLLRVTGKGSRTRLVPLGAQTVRAVDRYLRARAKHSAADLAVLDRQEGPAHRVRPGRARAGPRPPGRPSRAHPPAHVPTRLCPHDAGRGHAGDRPHGRRWLAEPRHGGAVRGVDAGGAGDRGRARAQSCRSTVPGTVGPGEARFRDALASALDLARRSMWARMSWLARVARSAGASLPSGSTSRSKRRQKPRRAGAVMATPPSRALVVRPPMRPQAAAGCSVSPQRLGEVLVAAEAEDLEPGVGAHRGGAAPRRRVDEERTEGRPRHIRVEGNDAGVEATGPQLRQDERPSLAGEPRVTAFEVAGRAREPARSADGTTNRRCQPALS